MEQFSFRAIKQIQGKKVQPASQNFAIALQTRTVAWWPEDWEGAVTFSEFSDLSLRDGILSITLHSPQQREAVVEGRERWIILEMTLDMTRVVLCKFDKIISTRLHQDGQASWTKLNLNKPPLTAALFRPLSSVSQTDKTCKKKYSFQSEDLFYLPKLMKIKE